MPGAAEPAPDLDPAGRTPVLSIAGLGRNHLAADFSDGRLTVRPGDYISATDGQVLDLTPHQLGLLVELVRCRNRVRSRKQLLDAVWGREPGVEPRIVDVVVMRLRAKLRERIPEVTYIHTHRGVGYRFSPEAPDSHPVH